MRRAHLTTTSLVTLLFFGVYALQPRAARAQAVPAAPSAAVPSCTTTTTTTCTGTAAPLAAPPQEVAPPTGYYPQPAYPPPLYLAPPQLRVHYEEEPRYGLVIAGAAIFGGSYLWNAFIGYVAGENAFLVPAIGPFIYAAQYNSRHSSCDGCYNNESDNRFTTALLVFDGLIQTAGLVMLIGGMVSKHKVAVYDRPSVSFLPTASPSGAGLAAIGRF